MLRKYFRRAMLIGDLAIRCRDCRQLSGMATIIRVCRQLFHNVGKIHGKEQLWRVANKKVNNLLESWMDSPCWPTIKYFLLNIFAGEQQNIFEQQVTIFIRSAADSVTIITLIVKYQTKILKSLLYICFYFWRCCIKKNFTIDPAYTEISKMSF